MTADLELETFKKGVSLEGYARTLGFERWLPECRGAFTVLRRKTDDGKLIVWAGSDGCARYRNERSQANGSIIDLVQETEGLSLGQARRRLRALMGLGEERTDSFPQGPVLKLIPIELDSKKVAAVWQAAQWITEIPYLVAGRGLSAETLSDDRFRDTFRLSTTGDIIFPQWDRGGMCGYERRAEGKKSFGANTVKGLWYTRNINTRSIVVCESPIDCLSHFQLYGWDVAYVSLGGSIGNRQRDLLAGLLAKANARQAAVIVGTDNDPAGDKYFEELSLLSPMRLGRLRPTGKDWNDDLAYVNRENG
jgi:Toprim-like